MYVQLYSTHTRMRELFEMMLSSTCLEKALLQGKKRGGRGKTLREMLCCGGGNSLCASGLAICPELSSVALCTSVEKPCEACLCCVAALPWKPA